MNLDEFENYGSDEKGMSLDDFESYGAQPEVTAEQPDITAGERGLAAVTGVNTLAPALLGLPMDTYTNAVNLARAAYGTGKHALTGSFDVPEMLPGQVGGSEWFKRKIEKGMGADVFTPPRPEDPTQQNIHMGSGIIASGAIAPTQGIKQTIGTMAKMAPSAGGAIAAKEAFPDQPLAPLAGMLAVPTAAAGASALKAKVAPKVTASQAFMKAHKLGYKVPPALAKPSKTQQAIEGSAGPVPVKQRASIHNQQITNKLIKQDIGYPKDVPLSREGLNEIRANAGKVYEQAKGMGTFKTDKTFNKDLSKIANQSSALAKEFPGMVKADVVKLSKTFNKKQISSEALVDAVKQLRADSSAGYRSSDPGVLALAKANGKMANALEALMERSVSATKPDLLPALKASRQRIAKTYEIEKALKGENVDAVALARSLDKGKPMSGLMRDVAEFGVNFKGAAQTNVPQSGNFRPMDLGAGVASAIATGNPWFLTLMAARPATRAAILSKPYQTMLTKALPEQMAAIKTLPSEARAAAIISLFEDVQRSGNQTSK